MSASNDNAAEAHAPAATEATRADFEAFGRDDGAFLATPFLIGLALLTAHESAAAVRGVRDHVMAARARMIAEGGASEEDANAYAAAAFREVARQTNLLIAEFGG